MFLCGWLALVAFVPVTLGANPGVKVKLTQKGLEYGRQLGIAALLVEFKSITIPDMSGKVKVNPIGKVQYSLTNMRVTSVGLPQSEVGLVPGSGVKLSVMNAFISLSGNWRVKYLRFIKDSGSLDVNVNGLTISTTISVASDETGHPVVSCVNCAASIGSAKIKFHGGASWLYNLFDNFIDKAFRKALQQKICPLVANAITDMNPRLKTLNVVARVDKYAEIEYSLVSSPNISDSDIEFGLKGEFYNVGEHVEPPFSPAAFSLPPESSNMLYLGVSAFTANTAGFVYNKAGALSQYITDDMIPKSSLIRLNTKSFGMFVPEIAKRYPGLMMKLLINTAKDPVLNFQPNNVTIQILGLMTAYAIQPNGTLSPLFVLNLDTSVSAQLSVTEMRLAGAIAMNKMDVTLKASYVGDFQIAALENIFNMVIKVAVIPKVNARLAEGYPLPTIDKMKMENTQLHILKDYMLIGTDVQLVV